MSSRPPRRPTPFLSMRPAARRGDAAREPHPSGLVMTARTEVEAAHGALRDTLLDLASPRFEADADDLAAAHSAARDRVHEAVGTYARALRRDGVGLPAALVAVRATVQDDTPALPFEVFAAVRRDAAQCCLEAFYAH